MDYVYYRSCFGDYHFNLCKICLLHCMSVTDNAFVVKEMISICSEYILLLLETLVTEVCWCIPVFVKIGHQIGITDGVATSFECKISNFTYETPAIDTT